MEFSDYLKQAEELEKEAEELTNEAGDFEQDAETLEERRMRKHQKQPSRKKPFPSTGGDKLERKRQRSREAAKQRELDKEKEKPQLPAVIRKDGEMVKRADGTMVRKDKARTGTVIPPEKDKNEIGPTPKKKRTVINVPPRRKDFQPPAVITKKKDDDPTPTDEPDEKKDDAEFPVGVGTGWEKPNLRFHHTGQPKMFRKSKQEKEKKEDGKQLDPKTASQRAEFKEWKTPEGEPVLFERSKKGLERIIGSSRTSQQQKIKARKQLQKKRKEQIKRADKTADNPDTDLATAVRAADASIDAKEKVKKYKAPPEKTKVKTDFGPPEKAFKDN